jgi:hypothetical protein
MPCSTRHRRLVTNRIAALAGDASECGVLSIGADVTGYDWEEDPQSGESMDSDKRDVFVCHASEDKDFVRPLADALQMAGLRTRYGEFASKLESP